MSLRHKKIIDDVKKKISNVHTYTYLFFSTKKFDLNLTFLASSFLMVVKASLILDVLSEKNKKIKLLILTENILNSFIL